MTTRFPPILDGHEDFITALPRHRRDFFTESAQGHVDLPRARRGGLGGSFVAIFLGDEKAEMNALGYAMQQMSDFLTICDQSDGQVRVIKTVADLDRALADGAFAGILHLEGADPIGRSLKELRVLYEAGLRSIGVVWSRPNLFGFGSLFRDPQPTAGLTEAGFRLLAECQRLGILIDVSHLNDAGFWDVARVMDRPFVASHSNVRALCPHPRNLTDEQIRAIAEKDGVVGVNFFTAFVRPDMGRGGAADFLAPPSAFDDTTLEMVCAHFDYLIDLVGDRHVAIGSDFDGAKMPEALADASKLPNLLEAFVGRGWSDDRIERVCFGNFRRVLSAVWKA